MSLQTGHNRDRRRRLLMEQSAAQDETGETTSGATRDVSTATHKHGNYGDGSFLDEHPRVIDFVPRKLYAYAFLFLAGLAGVLGLEAASPGLADWLPAALRNHPLRALALGQPGSLSTWFSTLMLLAASVVAIVVYSVRKYKTDDYHGHYRIWLWAALGWFVMASDEAASLHDAAADAISALAGTRLTGDGSVWWLVPAVFALGAIGSRLLVDVWNCRLATVALVAAILGDVLVVAMRFHWLPTPGDGREVLLYQGTWMLANLCLLTAMGLYARHVLLDAEGRLPPRVPKVARVKKVNEPVPRKESPRKDVARSDLPAAETVDKAEEAAEDDTAADTQWQPVHAAHPTATPILKRVDTPAPTAAAASPAPAAASDVSSGKLSKADRRALRERLLKERTERERKTAGW